MRRQMVFFSIEAKKKKKEIKHHSQISQLWKQVFHSFQKQILDPAGPTLAPKDSEFHER